jgi:nicotinamidase-related amidase
MSYERLTSENAAVLFIDHQTGLANGVQTQSPPEFINNVRALVRIAQIYKLPSIITDRTARSCRLLQKGFQRQQLCIDPARSTHGTTRIS